MYEYSSKSRQTNKNYQQPLINGRKSYNFLNMKASAQLSETDKRIQQIKRKYDTPNRKQRLSHLSNKKSDMNINKQNENYGTADFKTRSYIYSNLQSQGNENSLKQSKKNDSKNLMHNSRQKVYNNQNSNTKSSFVDKLSKQSDYYDSRNAMNKLYKNQNEEQFFKRVKQMKQSLLYGQSINKNQTDNNYPKPSQQSNFNRQQTNYNRLQSTCNKNQNNYNKQLAEFTNKNSQMIGSGYAQSKQSRAKAANYDTSGTVEKDRIDNIDKINQKIKGILQCLNMNQKTRITSKSILDMQKRSRVQTFSNYQNNSIHNRDALNNRQLAKTPMKSSICGSMSMGRQTFGIIHRYQRSELLQKIQINSQFVQNEKKLVDKQDDKWQKLSSKLEKYQFQTKIRMQKALQNSKQLQFQNHQTKIPQRNNRSFYEPPVTRTPKPIQVGRRDNRSVDFRDLRSKSFIHQNLSTNIKQARDKSVTPKDYTPKQYQMRSGKKLDDQIGRIQKKIHQFQQQKKRLGVQFKPFNYSNSKSTSNLTIGLNNFKYQQSDRKISQFTKNLYKNQKETQKEQQKQQNVSTFRQKKPFQRQKESDQFEKKLYQNRFQSKIQIKLQKSNPSSVRTSKFMSQNSSRVSKSQQEQQSYAVQNQIKDQIMKSKSQQFNYFFDQSLKKQTDQGIQQRKKKLMTLQNYSKQTNSQLKRLVDVLCNQVRLDEQFRNAKIWYQYYDHPHKQEQVRKLLSQKTNQEIKQILKVRQSQNNPFFTAQGHNSSIHKLIELYRSCENHWNNKVYKNFNQTLLQSQGFTNKQIDLQKKGHISLGDLVRFLNLQSGTFYRNRDLSLIFIRICRQNKNSTYTQVKFQWLQATFTK